jgi:hypothetical protein
MGYHVSITRERGAVRAPIPCDEWLAYVRASSVLRFETPAVNENGKRFARATHAARWVGGQDAWLRWSKGEIWTKSPSPELLRYMIEIAPAFAARVRGDEGEFYRTPDDSYYEQDEREVSPREHQQDAQARIARARRKRLVANLLRLLLLLLAAVLLIRSHRP